MRILVVDDEPDFLLTTRLLLEFFHHTVDVAENGQRAVDVARASRPDVVLMDLNMPIMDGMTATAILRTFPEMRHVLIVATSAYVDDPAWCERAKSSGMDHCLAKPMDFNALEALLVGNANTMEMRRPPAG